MADVSATEAARRFADLLDAVERGEEFTIVRSGNAVAHLAPVRRGRGADVKALLAQHVPDQQWAADVAEVRHHVAVDDRRRPFSSST